MCAVIKVGSVECGMLVDWAACVCVTIDCPGPTATWSAMFVHFQCFVNSSCPCENRPSVYCIAFSLLCVDHRNVHISLSLLPLSIWVMQHHWYVASFTVRLHNPCCFGLEGLHTSTYCVCRKGLCARDYARVMVGMVLCTAGYILQAVYVVKMCTQHTVWSSEWSSDL